MRLVSLVFAIAILAGTVPTAAQDHADLTALLTRYVQPRSDGVDGVDYDRWRDHTEDRKALEDYVVRLEATPVSTLGDADRFAFWANLYNAVTVRLILDENPKKSIREIRPHSFAFGPWGAKRVTVEGERLSLDNIEHDILRARFGDPRIHYALNCASVGCPNIRTEAWESATLEADLDAAARAYINHPRGATVTDRGLRISKIYKWYREDFGDSDEGVIAHLLQYADDDLRQAIEARPRIRGHEYDWDLNEADEPAQ